MSRKPKQPEQDYIPRMISLRARIEPAFVVTIESDSTGKKWSGHYFYGRTAKEALQRMRAAMKMGDYKHDEIKVSSPTPKRVAAVSWKEEVY